MVLYFLHILTCFNNGWYWFLSSPFSHCLTYRWLASSDKGVCYDIVITYDILSTCSLGVVFGFLSNQKFSDSISGFENTASSALQDGVNYLNDTLNVREGGRERKSKCYSLVFFFLACSKWQSLQLINSLWQQTELSTIVRVCSSCDVNLALWWSCIGTSTLCLQTQILNDLTNTSFSATDIGTELGGSIRNQLENDVNSAFSQITDVLNSKWCFW